MNPNKSTLSPQVTILNGHSMESAVNFTGVQVRSSPWSMVRTRCGARTRVGTRVSVGYVMESRSGTRGRDDCVDLFQSICVNAFRHEELGKVH